MVLNIATPRASLTTLNPVLHNTLNAFLPKITGGPSDYDLDQFDALRYLEFVLWFKV